MKTEFTSKESYSADDNATLNGQPFVELPRPRSTSTSG